MSPHAHLAAATDPAFTARSRTTGEIVRRVAVYLRPYKWMAVANVGCAVLSLAFALAYPQLIGLVIDKVIGEKQGAMLAPVMFGVHAVMVHNKSMLALVALAPIPLLTAGAFLYTVTAHRRYRAQRQAASAMNALLMDNLQGVRQIKAFGREPHEDSRFAQRADGLRQGTLEVMLAWANYSPAMSFVTALGTVFVLWYSGNQMLAGKMTLEELVKFLIYLTLFYEPVARLHGLNQMLQAARAAGERVFDILDSVAETANPNRRTVLPPEIRGEVKYENVHFAYTSERTVLRNINLHAPPGEMVALVGPTGAGKSTIVNLLAAFYEPTAGRITIDGYDISGLTLDSLRAQISVVSQEAFLFNG